MVLQTLKQFFGLRHTEYIALSRADLSAREAWAVVAPRLAACDPSLLLASVANGWGPIRQGIQPLLIHEGRITPGTAWRFNARTPDGKRQVTFCLCGDSALIRESQRITVFELDENGEQVRPRAAPRDWLDSPEIWNMVCEQPSFRPGLNPELSGVTLMLCEWFQTRHWCWVANCWFGKARDGVNVVVVLDAISGCALREEVTRYSAGWPVSKSAPN
jgi:hypothetical protein